MTYKNRFRLILLLFFFIYSDNLKSQANFESLVGIVNSEAITTYELDQRIMLLLKTLQLDDTITNRDSVRKRAIDLYIEDKLKIIEASNLGMEVTEKERNNFISQVFGVSYEEDKDRFEEFLKSENLDIDILLEGAEAEILWDKIKNQKFASQVTVSELEVKQEIDDLKSKIGEPQYNFSEIVVLKKNKSQIEAKKSIDKVRSLIEKNVPFESIAEKFSDSPSSIKGGRLGWTIESQISEDLRKIIENLEKGEISKIIPLSNGFKIVKLIDKKKIGESRKKTFDIINFSSNNLESLSKIRKSITSCNNNFEELTKDNEVRFDEIPEIKLIDLPIKTQNALANLKVNESSKILDVNNKLSFILVCKISGEINQEINESLVERQIFTKKINQISKTYLNKLKKQANIKLLVD